MDWKRFLWDVPTGYDDLKARVKRLNLLFYIMLVALILIYFGTEQLEEEVDICWEQLKEYKIVEANGGFPMGSCYDSNGYIYCNIDNFTLLEEDVTV